MPIIFLSILFTPTKNKKEITINRSVNRSDEKSAFIGIAKMAITKKINERLEQLVFNERIQPPFHSNNFFCGLRHIYIHKSF